MDYAPTNYIGNNQATRTKKTKAVVPAVKRVQSLDAKNQRGKRGAKRQTQVGTNGNVANGFLKTFFLPKLKEDETVQDCQKSTKLERDFYQSLSQLAEHYKIEPMQSNQFGYPYNLALAIWDMKGKLKQSILNWHEIRLLQDSKKIYFICEEKYNTGTTLYYIPIEPLFQMLHNPKRKRNAQLLVSICSYLYHIADIPYFRQEHSYLYWMYEMHKEWAEQDDENEENEAYKLEFEKAEFIGDSIEQKLFNPKSLQFFKQRLSTFKIHDVFDHECWVTASNAFALYREYPQESIYRNAPMPEQDTESEDYDTEIIGMDKYISFISHTKGWLYESIVQSINSEFNEYQEFQEPTICKYFDKKEVTQKNLDFENRLFALLVALCSLLYNYKSTRK